MMSNHSENNNTESTTNHHARRRDHITWHKDALKKLQDRGIPKDRAERALVVTGHVDVPSALSWLKSHSSDSSVSLPNPREYVLFLCPTGPFRQILDKFWENSYLHCGRNAAHGSFPHITLSSFFKVEDFKVPALLDLLDELVDYTLIKKPERFRLFFHRSQNYIGFFLDELSVAWLQDIVEKLCDKMLSMFNVKASPHGRQLHLTLAYQFDQHHQKALENLAKEINVDASGGWELHLYSRDPRFSNKEILIATHYHSPRSKEELELIPERYVILESSSTPYNGWYKGTCFSTGKGGIFPGNYTEKSSGWKCWTKHWVSPLVISNGVKQSRSRDASPMREMVTLPKQPSTSPKTLPRSFSQKPRTPPRSTSFSKTLTALSHKNSTKTRKPIPSEMMQTSSRRIFVMRHAERVDMTFGHDWISKFFDEEGIYHRWNLNLPKKIPARKEGPYSFFQDSPITEIGAFQARLTGESLRAQGIQVTHVFSSPALRSVQTAQAVLEGMSASDVVKIKVEPALYEWLIWCGGVLPHWLTIDELIDAGLNVDTSYIPGTVVNSSRLNESCEQFYNRTYSCMKFILKQVEGRNGDVLVVGHAASLEVCTRQLTGGAPKTQEDLVRVVQRIPYCGMSVIDDQYGRWKMIQPPIPALTHGQNHRFDWTILAGKQPMKPSAV